MAGLTGKLVSKTKIQSGGDVFHELWTSGNIRYPIFPLLKYKAVICMKVNMEKQAQSSSGDMCMGKAKTAKEVIEAVDEDNKSITFKVLEGDVMEEYKNFIITIHVDTKGEDNLVTWTVDYEKLHENVEDPNSVMEYFIHLTKEIEAHHLQ